MTRSPCLLTHSCVFLHLLHLGQTNAACYFLKPSFIFPLSLPDTLSPPPLPDVREESRVNAYYNAAAAVEQLLAAADQLSSSPSEEALKLVVDTLGAKRRALDGVPALLTAVPNTRVEAAVSRKLAGLDEAFRGAMERLRQQQLMQLPAPLAAARGSGPSSGGAVIASASGSRAVVPMAHGGSSGGGGGFRPVYDDYDERSAFTNNGGGRTAQAAGPRRQAAAGYYDRADELGPSYSTGHYDGPDGDDNGQLASHSEWQRVAPDDYGDSGGLSGFRGGSSAMTPASKANGGAKGGRSRQPVERPAWQD